VLKTVFPLLTRKKKGGGGGGGGKKGNGIGPSNPHDVIYELGQTASVFFVSTRSIPGDCCSYFVEYLRKGKGERKGGERKGKDTYVEVNRGPSYPRETDVSRTVMAIKKEKKKRREKRRDWD